MLLRAEAGREPNDRALRELIGELSTRSHGGRGNARSKPARARADAMRRRQPLERRCDRIDHERMTRENMDEDAAFSKVVDHLAESHPDTPRDHIEAAVDEARAHYDDAAVRDFVPILAEREARQPSNIPKRNVLLPADGTSSRARG